MHDGGRDSFASTRVVDQETGEVATVSARGSRPNSADSSAPSMYGASVISRTGDLIEGLPMGPDSGMHGGSGEGETRVVPESGIGTGVRRQARPKTSGGGLSHRRTEYDDARREAAADHLAATSAAQPGRAGAHSAAVDRPI